ncbi:ATP-binding protein [Nitratireductor aquimarinus]|uniref:phosphoribosyltransferase-like protein n=1 Tax=Nitratireductor aquimarinus TaxID=889300 RepID=UPI001A8C102A|nr:ATP-binding protein [Nitratireductor aquimarinus]MBN8242369.1 ATP-binding protein [Nitratireductor aquimarinus]MBY6130756.1 ATP-binding protein [Nitratireductor aquimarinus]MCA1302488.1 ATP-binding protein [Nitratireductor aquimarinus]
MSLRTQRCDWGGVKPGDFSVILETVVKQQCDIFHGLVEVKWGEIGSSERLSAEFEFAVHSQNKNVDWPSLQYASPYSTSVAEGENFIGRADLVRSLAGKILRSPMEPFYITGQKRIGKTSLALAAMEFARAQVSDDEVAYHYVLWGDVAHAEPSISVKLLGEGIQRFISSRLSSSIRIPEHDFKGSLAPLVAVTDIASAERPTKKFVIIIDEFDEIPQELFLQGNLAETFFANLRSLSRRKNICLILVGGENMPFIMDRQGQKLNNFARVNLSYFSRESEWGDFQQMVRKPVAGVMNWHEDAVSEIFNATNGNPYFAKIVCSGAFREAVSQTDTDLTSEEVRAATEKEIASLGSNSFAHLWQDGIPKPASEREPDILRRSRVLVAAARCSRQGVAITAANLMQNKSSAQISEIEISAVLNDFVQRNVLREDSDGYSFVLPIFDRWLREIGAQQLIADTLTEELALSIIAEENAAMIRSEEIVNLTQSWPTYRGRQIGTDDVRAWLEQVESPKEQRLLFSLLKRTRVYSEVLVRERLRDIFAYLRRQLNVPITRERNERRRDIVITYVDGEGKSGSAYAAMFAEENRIEAKAILNPVDFSSSYMARKAEVGDIGAVVILDDLVATGESLSGNVQAFLEQHGEAIADTKIRIMTIAATVKGKELVGRRLRKIDGYDIDFHTAETLPDSTCALPEDKSGFGSLDDWEKAKALITDLGTKIDKRRPLGFGNLGLLIVFPTNVPNNTIPIIRSFSRAGAGKRWVPIFERLVH